MRLQFKVAEEWGMSIDKEENIIKIEVEEEFATELLKGKKVEIVIPGEAGSFYEVRE